MSTAVLDKPTELTHRRYAPDCRRGALNRRVGGQRQRRREPAFARSTCSQHGRRSHADVVPQVRSGARPGGAQSGVGSIIYNDPLNQEDPTGLSPCTDGSCFRGPTVDLAVFLIPGRLIDPSEPYYVPGQNTTPCEGEGAKPKAGDWFGRCGPGDWDHRLPANQLWASWSARTMIRDFETLQHNAYDNDGGKFGNCTIGYGHLLHTGACRGGEIGMKWSNDQVNSQFDTDLFRGDHQIHATLQDAPLTQGEYDALAFVVFNYPAGLDSVAPLIKKGDYEGTGRRLLTMTAMAQGRPTAAYRAWEFNTYVHAGVGCGTGSAAKDPLHCGAGIIQ